MNLFNFLNIFIVIILIKIVKSNVNFLSYFDENYTILLNNGDSNYIFQQLEIPINFYNEKYDHIYINTNGIITFVREFPNYLNQPFPLEYPSIAPFYSNIDTTDANSSSVIVFYKTQNIVKLLNAAELIQESFPDNYPFEPTVLYVATWKNVGSFKSNNDKLNSFQVVIICDGAETYVQYIYDEINWLQADTDGSGGLPDVRGQAGFISEDGRFFTLNGSGTENVRYLNSLSNVNLPGVWLFRVGPLRTDEDIQEPNGFQPKIDTTISKKCSDNLHNCHSKANCIDNENGFCCQCQSGYYGNGFSCLKNNIPIRVIGSITGTINGESIENRAKLQSYIVMADGRSYTAINPINPEIGHTLSLAIPIGLGIGWLFAKPQNNIALNGYQLTGGKLNHLSTLKFLHTGEIFQINQTFDGLNHWDQLSMRIHLNGNLPSINVGTKLRTKPFIEEYQFITATKIRSIGQRQIQIIPNNEIIEYELEQLITFEKCLIDFDNDFQQIEPIYQKVSKINLDYNGQEQAIRIGLLAEIGISPTDSHPCNDGSAICGENTICVPDGDHYNCICQNGYENILEESDNDSNISQHCVDINECESDNKICGDNAYCENNAGGYTCVCHNGYERINYNCEPINNNIQENLIESDNNNNNNYDNNNNNYDNNNNNYDNNNNNYDNNNNNNYDYRSSTDGYFEYTSASNRDNPCDKCSSHAFCLNDICHCKEGWFGDGYYCSNCREDEHWIDGQCVPNYSVDEPFVQPYCTEDGECVCPEGYEFINEENLCRFIGNYDTDIKSEESIPCDVDFNCHENATCEWSEIDLRHLCICAPGLIGDGYICNKIEVSCTTQPNICDDHATCVYNVHIGKSECKCDEKYEGDGFTCHLAPECTSDEMCGGNSFCDNTICVCLDGFERDISDFCVPAGKCGGTYCTDNAICKWDTDQRIQYCECMEGYDGDGVSSCRSIPPACNVRNTCGLYASCNQNVHGNFECVCNHGYYGDGYVCVEEKNCMNTPSLCHPRASCEQTANGLNCVCEQGLLGNGTVCKEIQPHDSGFLLISQGVVIIRVPFNGKNGKPIAVASMAIGLDKDCVDGRVYWGDISAKKIMSSKYDGSESRAFITEGVESPEGIAIDWISRRIYWTDSSKDTIEVANLDNSKQRAIIINKNLVNPRGIAVDPFKQKLYWSDWNRESPKIEISNLDGSDREILVSQDLILPNSLVILNSNNNGDFDSGELCYADAGTHSIKCLNILNRITRQIAGNLSYPFGLTIDNNQNFLWTDWSTKQIESVDLQGMRKTGIRTPIFGSHKMYGMTAITDSCPLLHSICLDNGGCVDERLCLANNKETSYKTCKCTKLSKFCDNDNYFVD